MGTTSLKLSDEIKLKASNAAKDLGISSHAFMVEAIRLASVNAEYRKAFIDEAKLARQSALDANEAFDAKEVFEYLRSRIAGQQEKSVKAKPW